MFLSPHGLDPADEGPAAILFRALMRDHDLAAGADAIEGDQTLHDGVHDIRGEALLLRSCVSLTEADLSTASDRSQLDFLPNECERVCEV